MLQHVIILQSILLPPLLFLPSVLVDGGMHAREWVTVATAIGVLGHLVRLFLGGDCAEVPLTNIHWSVYYYRTPDLPKSSR